MSKKSRIKHEKPSFDDNFSDEFEDMFDEDLDELSRDIYSADGGDFDDGSRAKKKRDSRWKIERRRDMKKLHDDLDEWEEFGENYQW